MNKVNDVDLSDNIEFLFWVCEIVMNVTPPTLQNRGQAAGTMSTPIKDKL
jgi:hypothetical protein